MSSPADPSPQDPLRDEAAGASTGAGEGSRADESAREPEDELLPEADRSADPNSSTDLGSGTVKPAPNARHIAPRRGGPGVRIPGYHIEGIIGRGSTGTVYRARQENVDRVVALKVLHEELSSRPRMVRRLQREARTTARLAHPHIVTAIDMGRTGDRWWFAMEIVEGPSLALKLREEGRLAERDALRLFIPLCEALVHIWENGVVHRDIKPGNILIDRVSGARLADLGLAFADDDPHLTGSEGTLGTPHYISPEQARDPSSVDIRTDIWSFGATLFHAVCGEPPLSGANVAEVLSGVLYGSIPDPVDLEPDISRGLALVLRKCLSRDFERRYQSPRELLLDLERVRERRRPKVRAASLEPTAGSRHHPGRTLAAFGIAVVVIGGALLLWQRPWEDHSGRVEYAALTELAAELEAGRTPPGPLLARLEGLRPEVPAGDIERWRQLQSEARQALAQVLDAFEAETKLAFDDALANKNYPRAAALIGPDLDRGLVERAGLSRELAPTEFRLHIVPLEHRLARVLEEAETTRRNELVMAFNGAYLAEVQALTEAKRWRAARERLTVEPDQLPALLGVDLGDLPAPIRERLEGSLAGRLVGEREDLDRRWVALDAELVRWIELAARDLAAELAANLEPVNAGVRLRGGFEQELQRRGLVPDQMLIEPAGLARQKLTEQAADLEEYEERIAVGQSPSGRDALDSMGRWLDEVACGQAWQQRRYEEVEAYWLGRREWLLNNAAAAPSSWWGELEQRVEAHLLEARLLIAMRERAQARLGELDGSKIELHMAAGVRAAGRMALLESGSTGGLSFEVDDRSYDLYLAAPLGGLPPEARFLRPIDVISLSGFQPDVEEQRLSLALFHAREGQPDVALELLSRAAFSAAWSPLADQVQRNLERSQSVRAERQELRQAQALGLLSTLYLEEPDRLARLARDPERALATISRLRGDFSDLEPVAARMSLLELIEEGLTTTGGKPLLADFERAFGPGIVRFGPGETVELFYDFASIEVPGFEAEDWTPDGAGWLSPGDIKSDTDLIERAGPRLVLRSPLDVDARSLVAEFEFTEPASVGADRLVLVSVAGFQLVVRTPIGGSRSEVAASIRGFDELLNDLRTGGAERIPRPLLVGGNTHLLRVEVDKRRGTLRALLDGRDILEKDLSSPAGNPGSYGLMLRSSEQIRLLTIRVVGLR